MITLQKSPPPVTATQSSESSSVLLDAVTNNGQKVGSSLINVANTTTTSSSNLKLQTFQLVNSTNQQSKNPPAQQLTPTKAPVIQRIQSTNPLGNQTITKTIVNTSSLSGQPQSSLSTYKVRYIRLHYFLFFRKK